MPYLVSLTRDPGFSCPVLKTEKMVNTPSRMKNSSTPIATQISSSALSPFKKYTRGKVTKGRTRTISMTSGRICKDKKGENKIQEKKKKKKSYLLCQSFDEDDDEVLNENENIGLPPSQL